LKTRRIKDGVTATFPLLLNPTHGMNGRAKETPMTHYPYILFNKSPEQLRRLGALRENAAEAIAVLDAQFPWLRGAEKRVSWNQASHSPLVSAGSH